MFSGLIVYRGTVVSNEAASGGGRTLVIDANDAREEDAHTGDSIAVNGVCLTVTQIHHDRVSFDVVPETIERSTLGALAPEISRTSNIHCASAIAWADTSSTGTSTQRQT